MENISKIKFSVFAIILFILLPVNSALAFASNGNNSQVENISETEVDYNAAPELNVLIPEYANSRDMTLKGNTSPKAIVDLYTNNNLFHSLMADDQGNFEFRRIILDSSITNEIKVISRKRVGSPQTEQTGMVIVDDIFPEFVELSELPRITNSSSVNIKGKLSEPCNIYVEIYNSDKDNEDVITIAINESEFDYDLNLDEGISSVKIKAYDRAKNLVEESFNILVDTIPPVIEEDNILRLSPAYSRDVTIRGKVSEPADIEIIVYSEDDRSFQCPRELEGIDNQKCHTVDGRDLGISYRTTTDSDGYFSKKVYLLFQVTGSFMDPVSLNVRSDSREATQLGIGTSDIENRVKIIATDRAGNKDSVDERIRYATCETGDGDFIVWQKDIYPGALVPDHIFQGIAQFSFSLELDYIGRADHVVVNNIAIGTRELSLEDKEEWDTAVFSGGSNCATFGGGTDGLEWYIACKLRRWPADAYRNITEAYDKFKDQQTMNFPVTITIQYTEKVVDPVTGDFRDFPKTQVVCYDMEYLLDLRADPDWIPVNLLENTVELLNRLIEAIDRILPRVTQAKWIVAIGCFGSYVFNFISNLGETGACFGISSAEQNIIEAHLRGSKDYELDQDGRTRLEEALKGDNGNKNVPDNLQNCVQAKQKFLKASMASKWLCDRIFCPAVPSAQNYREEEIGFRNSLSPCSGRNKIIAAEARLDFTSPDTPQTMCEIDYQNEWRSACPVVNPYKESKELVNASDEPRNVISSLISGGLDICSWGQSRGESETVVFTEGGHSIRRDADGDSSHYSLVQPRTTEVEVDGTIAQDKTDKNYVPAQVSTGNHINFTERKVSRDENGCVFALPDELEAFDAEGSEMYSLPVDSEDRESRSVQLSRITNRNVLPSGKSCQGTLLRDVNGILYCQEDTDSRNVKRIDPIYVSTERSHGNTYSLSDATDNCLRTESVGRQDVRKIIVDPTSSVINAVRCVCLPAIEGYLISIRNIAMAIRNCFESILVSGEFNSGICKAILTQYVCDFVFDVIGCIGKSFAYTNREMDDDKTQRTPLRDFMTDLRNSGDKIKQGASRRYGNTQSFRTLFNERQLIHSLCLAAFGYDWMPALDQAMSMSGGGISIKTMGMIAPATRRFMSFNPARGGVANYVYHIGYFLTAGEPISWSLDLICSTTNDCDEADFENGRCDCSGQFTQNVVGSDLRDRVESYQQGYQLPQGNMEPGIGLIYRVDGGTLEGGETLGAGSGNPYSEALGGRGTGDLYVDLEHGVRYDKVRLCWTPLNRRANQPGEETGHPGCIGPIPIRLIGSRPPAMCTFNLALGGVFSCGMFSQADGFVYFTNIKENRDIPGTTVPGESYPYSPNEKISYEVNFAYQAPEDPSRAVEHFLRMTIHDENGIQVSPTYHSLSGELPHARGQMIFPPQPKSANDLLGGSASYVSTDVSRPNFVRTLVSNVINREIRINGRSTTHYFFIFKENDQWYYLLHEVRYVGGSSTNFIPADSLWQRRKSTYKPIFEQNKTIDNNALSGNDDNVKIWDVSKSIPDALDNFKIELNTNECNSGDCVVAYILRVGDNKLIPQRCAERGVDSLGWTARFSFVRADSSGNPSSIPAHAISGQQVTVSKPIRINCAETSPLFRDGRTAPCQKDVILKSNCMCGDNQYMRSEGVGVCREGNLQDNLETCPKLGENDDPFITKNLDRGRCAMPEGRGTCGNNTFYDDDFNCVAHTS